MMNKNLQEVNIQNMNVELVAQMFKNYQSNVLFHLEGTIGLSGFLHWPVVLTETQLLRTSRIPSNDRAMNFGRQEEKLQTMTPDSRCRTRIVQRD